MNRIPFLLIFIFTLLPAGAQTLTGVIVSVSGTEMIVQLDSVPALPLKTDTCAVSKDISGNNNPFGITVSGGWMGIGEAMLSGVKGALITMRIVRKTTSIVINGKLQEQFVKGRKLKIVWGAGR